MSEPGSPTYAVVHRAPQAAATTTRTVTMATMDRVADTIPPIVDWLAARGLAPSGPPFLRYRVIDTSAEMVVQAGVPVAVPVEGDEHVEPDELPDGDYLATVHTGSYDGLFDATVGLLTYAGEQGLRFDKHPSDDGEVWASRLEWYESGPEQEPDPSRWVTRLEFKLADGEPG